MVKELKNSKKRVSKQILVLYYMEKSIMAINVYCEAILFIEGYFNSTHPERRNHEQV